MNGIKPAPIVISLALMETVAHAQRRSIELPEGEGWAEMTFAGLVYRAWVPAQGATS